MYRAITVLLAGSILSKVVAFVRELVLAALFGTSAPVGVYRAASTVVLLPVNVFTTDLLSAAFLPTFKEWRARDPGQAAGLAWSFGLSLTVLSLITAGVLFVWADVWAGIVAPGFADEAQQATADFIRVMALGLPFAVVALLVAHAELASGRYWLASVRATVQSVCLIAATAAAFAFGMPSLLAWGFTSAFVVLAVLAIAASWQRSRSAPGVGDAIALVPRAWGSVLRVAAPVLAGPPLVQLVLVLERAVASRSGAEVLPALDYAKVVTDTAHALVAMPLALASLAELSGKSAHEVKAKLTRLLPFVIVVLVPASAVLVRHSPVVVALLFGRGAFSGQSIETTSRILTGLAVGFWAHSAGYVLLKTLAAQRRSGEALAIIVAGLVAAVAVIGLLVPHIGPVGFGLAWSAYGLVLVLLGSARLDVLGLALRYILAVLPGVVGYAVLLRAEPPWASWGPAAVAIDGALWLAYLLLVPRLRLALAAALPNARRHRS